MIIRREYYDSVSWWSWGKSRMLLTWAKFTGGFSRSLGLGATNISRWEDNGGGSKIRRRPVLSTTIDNKEMELARIICPTHAIKQESGWHINPQKCISCGLCFEVAPKSLTT